MARAELFLPTDDPAFTAHTGVWVRHVGGTHVASVLFAALEAGTYRILDADGSTLTTVDVVGGQLADVHLFSAAAQVAPGR